MQTEPPWRIVPMGDRCLLIDFGSSVERHVNDMVLMLADHLQAHAWPGVVDIVPAFCTLALHYRPESMPRGPHAPLPYAQLRAQVEALLATTWQAHARAPRTVDIPVCYGGVHGPDLAEVSAACGMPEEQVVALHANGNHAVFMLGFAPGHPYIGGLDARLSLPRRATPRARVERGSVAIANTQSVIYSIASPGGWNLIGRTPLRLFDAESEPPCLLGPGDILRFMPISAERFAELDGQAT